jgi:small subunit ribosomal protein S1
MTQSSAAFSMEDFASALEQFDYQFATGQVVKGKAVAYESHVVLIDIGAKSPALLPRDEASVYHVVDLELAVPEGEEREFLIIKDQNADGQVTVSLRQMEIRLMWGRFEEMQEANTSLQVRVLGANKGGLAVDAMGVKGFIPRSHLVEKENIEALKGQKLTVVVLEIDREKEKLVLSNRLASRAATFSQLTVGQLVSGKVSGLRPFGAFVDFDGNTGLLHIGQISNRRVNNVEELFKVGQPVMAMIANLEEGRGRIALSTKHFEFYPGEMLEKMAEVMAEAEERLDRAQKNLLNPPIA